MEKKHQGVCDSEGRSGPSDLRNMPQEEGGKINKKQTSVSIVNLTIDFDSAQWKADQLLRSLNFLIHR